jgi:hypothetical protein
MQQVLPLFVDEVPEYEARGEVMFVRWKGLEIALPISVCIAAVGRCECEISRWNRARSDAGRVVRFTRKRRKAVH